MSLIHAIDYVNKQISESPQILHAKAHDVMGKLYPTRTIYVKIKQYICAHLNGELRTEKRWVVVPGLRGIGKSTLLAQTYELLLKGVDIEFIYFSLDDVVESLGSNLHAVLSAYEKIKGISLATCDKKVFIFLDEVHYDSSWSATAKVLIDKNPNIFIFATGSSAIALQRNADEQRRIQVERLYPMSFAEYVVIKYRITPPTGLKQSINSAIFEQEKAEDIYARLTGLSRQVDNYWSKIPSEALFDYMQTGSIPFTTLCQEKHQAFDAIYQTIRAIVEVDLPLIGNFKKSTIQLVLQVLSILAVSSGISTNKLAINLGMRHETVSEILVALVKTELVIEVPPFGSIKGSTGKARKYLFMSPALRASILFVIGGMALLERHKGERFEDVVGMYLYREITARHKGNVSYFEQGRDLHVDFIIKTGNKPIPLEVSIGKKDTRQLWEIMDKVKAPYGIICHAKKLSIHSDKVVKIPHNYFLLA